MSANVFAKLIRKTTTAMHHQAVRTQSRKSLETLDQTLNNQSNEDSLVTPESAISPKLSLASLHLNDPPTITATVMPPPSARSSVNTFKPHALVKSKARLVQDRKSVSELDEKFKLLREALNMPADALQTDVLTCATDLLLGLRGENQKLTNTVAHMSQLLVLTMKELGQVRAENKLLSTPPSRPIKQSINQSSGVRPPRYPSLKRLHAPMYHDSFTYDTPDAYDSTHVKLEPIDSLSRSSSHSSESSLFTLSQAASLVSEKPNLTSLQLNQLMALMKLQQQVRETMPIGMDSVDKAQPISKRQRIDIKPSGFSTPRKS